MSNLESLKVSESALLDEMAVVNQRYLKSWQALKNPMLDESQELTGQSLAR
jgi:hypothetical protein